MFNRFVLFGILFGGVIAGFELWPIGGLAGLFLGWILNQSKLALEELKSKADLRELHLQELRVLVFEQAGRLQQLEEALRARPESSSSARVPSEVTGALAPAVAPEPLVSVSAGSPVAESLEAPPGAAPLEAATSEVERHEAPPSETAPTEVLQPHKPAPPPPDWSELAAAYVKELIFGGNTVVRAGIAVLLVGVTLLLKYAAENSLLPLELRMAGAGLVGVALILVGLRARNKQKGFAETLQGGGVATMYLVVFFSYRVYELLPATLAFALLVAIAVLSGVLAIVQNAMSLVVIGQLGGFVAPILASSGGGSHVALFGYYLLLNLLVAGVAWFRSWRPLNLVGFVFTFGIGTAWGVLNYEAENFATTEPFLVTFYLLYVAIPVLFALRGPSKGWVDGSLVFGAPLAFLALQLVLVRDWPFAMAFTSVLVAALYLGLTRLLRHRAFAEFEAMRSSFIALGIGFLTLAIPYGLDDSQLSSATWAIEGAGLYFLGVKQQRIFSRVAGVGLQVLAGGALLTHGRSSPGVDALPFVHGRVLAAMFLLLACLFIAQHAYQKRKELLSSECKALQLLIFWGLLFLLPIFYSEFERTVSVRWVAGVELAFLAALGISLEFLGRFRDWPWVRYAPASLCLFLIPLSMLWLSGHAQTMLSDGGLVAWPLYFVSLYFSLRGFVPRFREQLAFLHISVLWGVSLWTALTFYSISDKLLTLSPPWELAAFGMPFVVLLAMLVKAKQSKLWPLCEERELYMKWGRLGLLVASLAMALLLNLGSSGQDDLIGYLPLLNPGELFQIAALLAVFSWWRSEQQGERFVSPQVTDGVAKVVLVCAFFSWNGLLARSMHRFYGVSWDFDQLWNFGPLQVAFAVSWAVLGLIVTGLASRAKKRVAWIVGASLLGAVVVKLFLLDLANLSAVPKIVTFLAVGVLLLLVGYFSPVPPASEQKA